MNQPATESARTTVSVTVPTRERLEQLERKLALDLPKGQRMTSDIAVSWLLDVADAADLP